MTTMQPILDLAATKPWSNFQFDVKNVFLHGGLKKKKKVYVTTSPGYAVPNTMYVCRLRQSLYRLKRAPHA